MSKQKNTKLKKENQLTTQEIKARRKALWIVFGISMSIMLILALPLGIMEATGLMTRI